MAIAEREITGPVQTAAEDTTDEDFVPQPYRWTREQFNEMGDMGLFEGRRAISVEGEILAMPAMKKPHRTAFVLADAAFRAAFGSGYFMSVQSPFKVGKATDPEPDLAVITGSVQDYADQDLTAAEIIVEISDTTYSYDRREKASLYAASGVQDYWIVRLKTRQLEVYRQPQPDDTQPFGFGYGEKTIHESGEIVQPLRAANPVAVSALLPNKINDTSRKEKFENGFWKKKVSVIGAGAVGATVAFHVAQQGYADVVLLDLPDDLTLEKPRKTGSMAQGKALDLNQVAPIVGYDGRMTGTSDYADTASSDVVVITSGRPRTPGMSREDLLAVNADIVQSVAAQAAAVSPDAVYIVVSNPLDAMCHVALKASGLPSERVVGQAGVLDSTRYRNSIAAAVGVSVEDVQAYVLGGHGDQMVPVRSLTTVGGIPVQKWVDLGKLTSEQLQKIEDDTRQGGGILTGLIGTSAWYAPGVATAEMVEAVLLDRKRILACTVLLDGQYGVSGLYFGVPTLLGASGVEAVYDLMQLAPLTDVELAGIKELASKVQEAVNSLKTLGKL